MFNWFRKTALAVKSEPELDVAAIQGGDSITPLAISESEAFKNQGNAHLGNGKLEDAAECYRRAIARNPHNAEAYTYLGYVFQVQGNPNEAVALYRKAVVFKPNLLTAHINLSTALMNLGQFDAAEESLRRVIALAPEHAAAWQCLGEIAAQRGDLDHAETLLRHALELQPDFADAHVSLGRVLTCLGQLDDAVVSYGRALELKPDHAVAHINLGRAFTSLEQLDEAVSSFRSALEINPDYVEAHINLGSALTNLGQFDEALESLRRALELKPDHSVAYINLGIALAAIGQIDGARVSYSSALEIKPDDIEAHIKLGNSFRDLGQLDDALASYHRALEIKPDYAEAHNKLLLSLNYTSSHAPSYYLEQARLFGRIVAGKVSKRFSTWRCAARPKRLRVGLVSGDLRKHSVGFFLEGMLIHIDPARIELFAYPTHHGEDELTARIRPYFSAWRHVFDGNDEAAARLIHADGVHILFDLSGHTAHNRLPVFAWKPAPVQVTWLGLPSTTGVAEMDYVLGDPHAIPAEYENHFSETVWRMPESYLCLTVPVSPVKAVPLPALSTGYVTFGSFNNLTKMNDAVVAVWARILQSVPNSRLLLKARQLNDLVVCEKTYQRFAACGIAPSRLLLSGTFASADDHLAAYNKVDIALDTFPYPGVTTSVEALWMGVPVLSLRGDRFLSRTAESIAHNAGLPDWVAADEDDYEAKAVSFTSKLERLATLRAGLRQQVLASPLFDAPRFARNFEDALWGMWEKYQAQ
jgi:predicted O-linked N-acetylglucosamine transferase (SPINDLY family)